ncbi:hypothetical protein CR513_60370, partial [Mucuna pruriens]
MLGGESSALVWWNQVLYDVRRRMRPNAKLRRVLRERFILVYYARDLYNKLQRLYQGFKSVEDYYKEEEMTLVRVQVEEYQEATMARFLHCLNKEI